MTNNRGENYFQSFLLLMAIMISMSSCIPINHDNQLVTIHSRKRNCMFEMRQVLDNIVQKVKAGLEPDFKALEAVEQECSLQDVYLCQNGETRDIQGVIMQADEIEFLRTNKSLYCYEYNLPTQVMQTGFWYELCYEVQTSYRQCLVKNENNTQCLTDWFIYYAQLYETQKIYLALIVSSPLKQKYYEMCKRYYQDPNKEQINNFDNESNESTSFTLPREYFYETLKQISLPVLYNKSDWVFRPDPGLLLINNMYSYDMELFFNVKDLQLLYQWEKDMEFLAICELASGDFPQCLSINFQNYEDFKICVEAQLSILSCYNYLSEDQKARRVLYNVCRFNKSKHLMEIVDEKETSVQLKQDNIEFKDKFPTCEAFEYLLD